LCFFYFCLFVGLFFFFFGGVGVLVFFFFFVVGFFFFCVGWGVFFWGAPRGRARLGFGKVPPRIVFGSGLCFSALLLRTQPFEAPSGVLVPRPIGADAESVSRFGNGHGSKEPNRGADSPEGESLGPSRKPIRFSGTLE
jgi:hypothetical protein